MIIPKWELVVVGKDREGCGGEWGIQKYHVEDEPKSNITVEEKACH